MTGTQALANAIILQAARDYKTALRILKRYPQNREARDKAIELERFFRSAWFGVLSPVRPDYLIQKLRKEAA